MWASLALLDTWVCGGGGGSCLDGRGGDRNIEVGGGGGTYKP